jgi:hypothetical protein
MSARETQEVSIFFSFKTNQVQVETQKGEKGTNETNKGHD